MKYLSHYRICTERAVSPRDYLIHEKDEIVYCPLSLKDLSIRFILKSKIPYDSLPNDLKENINHQSSEDEHYLLKNRTSPCVVNEGIKVGVFNSIPLLLQQPCPWIFSCDLISSAKKFLHFLFQIDTTRKLQTNTIVRYQMFLYLQSQNLDTVLIPPYDVEIIWLQHMLQSHEYRFTARLFKPGLEYIPHSITRDLNEDQKKIMVNETRILWNKVFEDYHYDDIEKRVYLKSLPFELLVLDIYQIETMWIKEFKKATMSEALNVSDIPDEFFERAMLGYQKFLYVVTKYPKYTEQIMFAPCPGIDLMWHTHLVQPESHEKDSVFLTFKSRDHKLLPVEHRYEMFYDKKRDFEEKLWNDEFGESMAYYLPIYL